MTVEIERKFILSMAPPSDQMSTGVHIRQGYLAEEEAVEVRIRITSAGATLTVKAGKGISRTEVDVPISVEDAEQLWPHTAGRRIDKTRHRVPLDDRSGLVAEIDVYAGALDGLIVAEVEFTSPSEAAAFIAPAWFGREVTGEPGWSNASLARNGRPD